MKRSLLAVAVFGALAACAQLHLPGMGWQTLLDGDKGLENFDRVGDANWRAEGAAIVADRGKSGFLVSKSAYKDFELRVEFWAESDTNSGVFIRCNNREKIDSKNCYEVNIWDNRPDPKYGTGAIVDVAAVPVPLMNRAGGRWNTYEITAKGQHMTVRLNGVKTVEVDETKINHAAGAFGLQYAVGGEKGAQGGPIKWRKVQIRPL